MDNIVYLAAGDLPSAFGDLQRLSSSVFVLADEHTRQHCLPLLGSDVPAERVITVPAGDGHKDLQTLSTIWQQLQQQKADRYSILVNLGGGMVTDLGGFAAACFKRGIAYVNIPTTLLAMVDAAVGGKTAINFGGFKNEIGSFYPPRSVWFCTDFLRTLDTANLLSGYAEMLKHGLISDTSHLGRLLNFDWQEVDYGELGELVRDSVQVKQQVVEADPREQGLRKVLNFGHTVGHAFEEMCLADGHPVLHGYAVAWGLVAELYLSMALSGFPQPRLWQVVQYVKSLYGFIPFTCNDYDRLLELMRHDKKNRGGVINFTLLSDVGRCHIDQTASREQICEAFDFYRECMA